MQTSQDNNSAYRILMDSNSYQPQRGALLDRGNRTKNLLSGDMVRRNGAFISNPVTQHVQNISPQPNTFPQSSVFKAAPISSVNAANYGPYNNTPHPVLPQYNYGGHNSSSLFPKDFLAPRKTNVSHHSRSSSRSSKSSGTKLSRRHSRRKHIRHPKRRDNYDITDSSASDSDSNNSSSGYEQGLNTRQKKLIQSTIKDYCPENLQNVIYADVIAQMDGLQDKGFKLPKDYDKQKHNLNENEIKLYEMQIQRDKKRDQKKMSYMLNFGAQGLAWFCTFLAVDWIKTKYLPEMIRLAVSNGDFDDGLEGIGNYMRGSVVDSPIFSTGLKFVEIMGQSHQRQIEEDIDKLEEFEEKKAERLTEGLRVINKFRKPTDMPFNVPAPIAKKMMRNPNKDTQV
jgi:hypothetical protein